MKRYQFLIKNSRENQTDDSTWSVGHTFATLDDAKSFLESITTQIEIGEMNLMGMADVYVWNSSKRLTKYRCGILKEVDE